MDDLGTPIKTIYIVFFTSQRSGFYEALEPLPGNWTSDLQPWRVWKLDETGTPVRLKRTTIAYLNFSLIEEIALKES